MRQATEEGFSLIQRLEGFMGFPYKDAAGLLTIGYGHLCHKSEVSSGKVQILRGYVRIDEGLSECQASILLDQDLEDFESVLSEDTLKLDLSDHQYDALVSFTMNIGLGAYLGSTLRKRLLEKKYELAADQFQRWVFAGGRKLKGLEKRRSIERTLFQTGVYGSP